jgi:hypothetical protein
VHVGVVDEVVVVDDDDELVADGREVVHESGYHDKIVALGTDDDRGELMHVRERLADGLHQVGPEPGRVRIALLDLQPRDKVRPAGQPGRQQRRLARACRSAEQHQPDVSICGGVEALVQA